MEIICAWVVDLQPVKSSLLRTFGRIRCNFFIYVYIYIYECIKIYLIMNLFILIYYISIYLSLYLSIYLYTYIYLSPSFALLDNDNPSVPKPSINHLCPSLLSPLPPIAPPPSSLPPLPPSSSLSLNTMSKQS